MRIRSAAALAIAMAPVVAAGQQFLPNIGPPADPNTRFEVVAIKPVGDGTPAVLMRMTPGRFESSAPVGLLLRQALQKPDYQMVGAPGWIDRERYSIAATMPDGVPPTASSVLLLNLLKDRFQLTTHVETRELRSSISSWPAPMAGSVRISRSRLPSAGRRSLDASPARVPLDVAARLHRFRSSRVPMTRCRAASSEDLPVARKLPATPCPVSSRRCRTS